MVRCSRSVARNNGDAEAPVLTHSTASTTPSVASLRPALSLDEEFFPLACIWGDGWKSKSQPLLPGGHPAAKWISLDSRVFLYHRVVYFSASVWTWTRRSWHRSCRPTRLSRTSATVSSWSAWLSSPPAPSYSRPSPASPLGSAGLLVASPSFFLRPPRPPAPRGEPGLPVPLVKHYVPGGVDFRNPGMEDVFLNLYFSLIMSFRPLVLSSCPPINWGVFFCLFFCL